MPGSPSVLAVHARSDGGPVATLDSNQRREGDAFAPCTDIPREWRSSMEAEKNPLEAVRAMMIENLERSRTATQSYIDLVEKTMRGFPSANESQISAFKGYIERQVAANHAFVDKLLRAKDFPEAFRIELEYFQSQLAAATENASQVGLKMSNLFNRSPG
jgi:hypothetical protein